MRVVIDGRFLGQRITGVQRYAVEVVRGLDRLLDRDPVRRQRFQFVLAAPRGKSRSIEAGHIQVTEVGRLQGHAWEQVELDRFSGDDQLLCLGNVAPLRRRQQVVTLHDASVFAQPAAYSLVFRTWYRLVQRQVGRRARMILTDSEFSRRELQHHLGIPDNRLRVVPLGGDHLDRVAADVSILARHGLGQRPFVLAVSSVAPHKNFVLALRAFELVRRELAEVDFVIAGGRFQHVFGGLELPDIGAINVGYVNDAELKALYQHAACFVYPSHYEGFGLPPLEAMACGCPVVLSSAASLPEVGGEAAVYFEPSDPAALAQCILRVLRDPGLRHQLRSSGRSRAASLTWDRTAEAVFRALEDARLL